MTLEKNWNRLIESDEGTITIDGKDVCSFKPEELRRGIGYAIQNTGLFPHMTVRENISVVPKLLKWKDAETLERVKELLMLVGLDPVKYINKYPNELSGGEAQRVGVARALAVNPQIILMDEPFGAVDPINRAVLQDEFLRIQQQLKTTVIFVTHDIDEAMKMGNRIAIMANGRIECYDTPERTILSDNAFVRKFLGKESYIRVLTKFDVRDVASRETVALTPDAVTVPASLNLRDAFGIMLEEGREELPVVDENGNSIGVLRVGDVVRVYTGTEKG